VLPVLAGLANLLPRLSDNGDRPLQKRWLPFAFYLGWMVVTACHMGGIGYSLGFNWNLSLLTPLLWVASWTLHLRRNDFLRAPKKVVEQTLLLVPLLVPLLAMDNQPLLSVFASLNMVWYAARFVLKDRSRPALIQLLGAATLLLGALPVTFLDQVVPGIPRAEWIALCGVLCFFWLIFLSRDPRIALAAIAGVLILCSSLAPGFGRLAIHICLVSILAHSLRWDDRLHRGSAILRILAGSLWVFLAISWLRESPHVGRLPVYLVACALLIFYVIYCSIRGEWKRWLIPCFAIIVLVSEPASRMTESLANASPGILAIAASFLLFVLGSFVAFSKARGYPGWD
jgi:hypothetical protein